MIKVTKHDIGAEILSILTKGIYPDPRDTLREYVQNGVDAEAENIVIKIRGRSIVVEDDGSGMHEDTLRKAVRVGISDKTPTVDVGFRGIGIYSSFHLCDRLDIYTRLKENGGKPYLLTFDFKGMRELLKEQQEARTANKISGTELIDLQSLLSNHISMKVLEYSDFVKSGTRVELSGLEPSFFKSLSKFNEVSQYLQQVVPLHFDPDFKWRTKIEKKIQDVCEEYEAKFRLVNLTLQVNAQIENLYRPYKDEEFEDDPLEPIFKELKAQGEFLGVAWGCLNSARKKIKNKELRGFIIKKQGFAIGKRSDLVKYFGRSTFFDRYIGEIIVVHPDLLPNAARTDFEPSPLRAVFYEALSEVAGHYNEKANEYQEFTLGDEQLEQAINSLKEIEANLPYNADNTEQLLEIIVDVRTMRDQFEDKLERKSFRHERRKDADTVIKGAKAIEKEIQNLINKRIAVEKGRTKPKTIEERSLERIKNLPETQLESPFKTVQPQNLFELLESLDMSIPDYLTPAIEIIDERFIQAVANSKADYLRLLNRLGEEIQEFLQQKS